VLSKNGWLKAPGGTCGPWLGGQIGRRSPWATISRHTISPRQHRLPRLSHRTKVDNRAPFSGRLPPLSQSVSQSVSQSGLPTFGVWARPWQVSLDLSPNPTRELMYISCNIYLFMSGPGDCPVNPHLMYIWCNIYLFIYLFMAVGALAHNNSHVQLRSQLHTRRTPVPACAA
jgi:hypothetical protein